MNREELDSKYVSVQVYTPRIKGDSHTYFKNVVGLLRIAKIGCSTPKMFERIGDYFSERAPIERLRNMEKRKEAPNKKKKLRRESDNVSSYERPKAKRPPYNEGTEEFLACLIYDIVNPQKRDKFVASFFDDVSLNNLSLVVSYYTGPSTVNNNLLETLILAGDPGKEIAKKIGRTIEKIFKDEQKIAGVINLPTLAGEAARMYYLSSDEDFKNYMSRLSRQNSSLYDELGIEDPRTLFICSGNVTEGVTYRQRLDALKAVAKESLGIRDKRSNGTGSPADVSKIGGAARA